MVPEPPSTVVPTLEQSPEELEAALEEKRAAVTAVTTEGAACDQAIREASRRAQAATQVCLGPL